MASRGQDPFWKASEAIDHFRTETFDFFDADHALALQSDTPYYNFNEKFQRWRKKRLEKENQILFVSSAVRGTVKRKRFGAEQMYNFRSRDVRLIGCGRKNKYMILFTQKM